MNRALFVLLAGVAFGTSLNRPAQAQLAPQIIPQVAPNATTLAQSPKSTHYVKLKNVPASLMAFWLDPKNHPQPRELGAPKIPLVANAVGGFTLPAGVDQIVAIDPQDAVLVFGTDAGAAELEKTITFLDQAQRRVEIEVQWVEVQAGDVRRFGIEFPASEFRAQSNGLATPPTKNTGPQLGTVRGNFAATLSALVGQNRAKILASPRLTMVNNFAGQVSSFVASPAAVKIEGEVPELAPFFQGTTQIGVEYGFDITPTINNDDTVTVLMTTSSKLKIKTANGNELLAAEPLTSLQSIANVRDGETVALTGLSSRPTTAKEAKSPSNLIIFVTARIVRRAAEVAVPAAK